MTAKARTVSASSAASGDVRRPALRGSVLVMSYFVVLVMTLVAIPQTLRSLGSVRLEQRFAVNRQLMQVAEGGLDEAVGSRLTQQPFFGLPADSNETSYAGDGGTGVSTAGAPGSACPAVPATWSGTWDCLPGSASFPGYAPGSAAYLIYAQDIGSGQAGPSVLTTQKRLRIAARYPPSPVNQHDLVLEAVVNVKRRYDKTGVRAGSKLQITAGNTEEDIILHGEEIYVYGPVTGNTWSDAPIHVGGNQAIWGKVYVNQSAGSEICCSPTEAPPDAVGLAAGNTWQGARIRIWDSNADPSIPASYQNLPIVAVNPWNGSDPDFDLTNFSPDGLNINPEYAGQLPQFMPPGTPFTFEPVTMESSDPGCGTRPVVAPGSGRVTTFCRVGDNAGVCAGTQTDTNPVYHIGNQVTIDGEDTVEYCVQYLRAGEGAQVRFQGDHIRVYASGYDTYSGWEYAYWAKVNSVVYSFKTNEQFTAGLALGDPNRAGQMSWQVLDSNTYVESGQTKVPEVRIRGDAFYGSVYAPRSRVELYAATMATRTPQPIFGDAVIIGDQGSGYVRVEPQEASEKNRVIDVEVLAWRRCLNNTCMQ